MDKARRGKGLEQMGRGDYQVMDREKVITHFNDAIEASGNNNKWRFVRVDVIKDALELLKGQTVGGWVSVKDRLPEEQENPYTHDYQEVICCLVTRFGRDVRVYSYGGGHFWHGPKEVDKYVSHWMPFPDLPKEEEHE